jgi:hypothetical protein
MKIRLLLTGALMVIALLSFGQSVTPDERLSVRYDKAYLDQLAENAPVTLKLMNFSLDHAWFIEEGLEEKYESLPQLYYINPETGEKSDTPVRSFNAADFNMYACYFEQGLYNRTYYRIGNTGIVVAFYSSAEVAEMYNKEKGLSHE